MGDVKPAVMLPQVTATVIDERLQPVPSSMSGSMAPVNRLDVSWTESVGAFRYLVYAYEYTSDEIIDLEESLALDIGVADTTISMPFIFTFPGNYMLEVWAVDMNLYDYYRSRADRPEVEIINHISGGIGLFGSKVVRRRFIRIEE